MNVIVIKMSHVLLTLTCVAVTILIIVQMRMHIMVVELFMMTLYDMNYDTTHLVRIAIVFCHFSISSSPF